VPDLHELLDRAVAGPTGPAPLEAIVRRGRRRALAARAAAAGAAAVTLLLAASLLPGPTAEPPLVDESPGDDLVDEAPGEEAGPDETPRPDDDAVTLAMQVTMQPGFDGPEADLVARRFDERAIPGSAEVLTWSENGLGRVEVVRYRNDRGEVDVSTAEDVAAGERAVRIDGPECVSVSRPEGVASEPTCGEPGNVEWFPAELRGVRSGTITCELAQVELSVEPDATEVVLELPTGRTVVVEPYDGQLAVRYPGHWGAPERSRAYGDDGALLATYEHDASRGFGAGDCAAQASRAAWTAATSIVVAGARGRTYGVDHARSVRWSEDPAGEVVAELVSLEEGVALRLRLPREEADAARMGASVWLPTVDLADPFPRFDPVDGDGCDGDLAYGATSVQGELRCELVSDAGETIAVRIELSLVADEP
jgi:hypothetical protein